MFEFLLLFLFFWWFFSRNERRKNKKRSFFKPSLDQELKELIQSEDNSTGIALSVKQYLLDVLDDDNNDREKYSDERLAQGQLILDKAFASSKIEESQITPIFLEGLMDGLDQVKGIFDSGSPDRMYLDKLISTIFEFYKLLKNK